MQIQKIIMLFCALHMQSLCASKKTFIAGEKLINPSEKPVLCESGSIYATNSPIGEIIVKPGLHVDSATLAIYRQYVLDLDPTQMSGGEDIISINDIKFALDGTLLSPVNGDKITLSGPHTMVKKVTFKSGEGIVQLHDGATVEEVVGGKKVIIHGSLQKELQQGVVISD